MTDDRLRRVVEEAIAGTKAPATQTLRPLAAMRDSDLQAARLVIAHDMDPSETWTGGGRLRPRCALNSARSKPTRPI